MAVDQTQAEPDREAVAAALAVLDRFMGALNEGDEKALLATLHFPHYRLAGGRMQSGKSRGLISSISTAAPARTGTIAHGISAN